MAYIFTKLQTGSFIEYAKVYSKITLQMRVVNSAVDDMYLLKKNTKSLAKIMENSSKI